MKGQKFRYTQVGTLDPGTGTVASTSVRVTSLYDVDYTGTGTTPPRFTQFAAFFQKHVVRSAHIKVHFVVNASVGPGHVVAIQLNEGSSAASDIPSMISDPRTNYGILGQNAGAHDIVTVQNHYTPESFFGISKSAISAYDAINVATNANPSDNVFFTIHAMFLNAAVDPAALYFIAVVDFVCDFKDPKLVAQA
jgi:hypothetical protein